MPPPASPLQRWRSSSRSRSSAASAAPTVALGAVLGLAAVSLQGCGLRFSKDADDSPLEVCPGVTFRGDGHVAQSRAGSLVQITCPTDYVYDGPDIECSWVDRFCVSYHDHEVDPDFCYNQYNLTLAGQGLVVWPEDVSPKIMLPPGAPVVGGSNITMPTGRNFTLNRSAVRFATGRRLRSAAGALPKIITAEQLVCKDEGYTELDFEAAGVKFQQDPWRLEFQSLARYRGEEVNLVVTAQSHRMSVDPKSNGKGSAMGRVTLNQSDVALRFGFVSARSGRDIVLDKVFFTLFDIIDDFDESKNLQIRADHLAEYFLSKKTRVVTKEFDVSGGSCDYAFGGRALADSSAPPPPPVAPQPAGAQVSVKDMWLDSLNRTVVLMFRNTSGFTLHVRASSAVAAGGHSLEFTGWSEVASVGKKMMCAREQHEEALQAKVGLSVGTASAAGWRSRRGDGLLGCASLVAVAAGIAVAMGRWARRGPVSPAPPLLGDGAAPCLPLTEE